MFEHVCIFVIKFSEDCQRFIYRIFIMTFQFFHTFVYLHQRKHNNLTVVIFISSCKKGCRNFKESDK